MILAKYKYNDLLDDLQFGILDSKGSRSSTAAVYKDRWMILSRLGGKGKA